MAYVCKCEVCKGERAARRAVEAHNKALEQLERERAEEKMAVGARVIELAKSPGQDLWTSGDGSRVPVREMSFAHLFYAIAKASRNEYPDSKTRALGVQALKREATYRLLREVV